MKQKLFVLCMSAALLLAGCGGGAMAGSTAASSAPSTPGAPSGEFQESWGGENYWDMGGADFAPAEPDIPLGEDESGSVYQNTRAKLIRRAELSIQTEQFDQSEAALNQLVDSCGGYFETSSRYGGSWRDVNANRNGEYTVRVPAEKYSQFVTSAGDLGYVTSINETSEDVGEAYYDTEARLKTQRTKQERLLALLERAETMEDIIALENALSDVEYQIEQYSSTLNRYDALIGFATFNIYLNEVNRVTQEVGETASLGARMAAGFQASFRGLGQGFQNFLIWASYNIFLLVILAAVAVVAVIVGKRELDKRNGKGDKKGEQEHP